MGVFKRAGNEKEVMGGGEISQSITSLKKRRNH
jgi:hypothetical protein